MATTAIPNPMLNNTGVMGAGGFNGGALFSTSTGTGGPGTMNYGNGMNPNAVFGSGTTGSSPTATPTATAQPTATTAPTSGGVTTPGGFVQPYQDQGGHAVASGNNPYGMTEGQQYWQLKYLQDAFGPMGPMIYQYLNSNGGYNSQVTQQSVDAQTNAMQRQTQTGANAVESALSSMGVSGSSSTMADALSAYENQATQQRNAITAQEYYQMWNSSQDREAQMMEFAAQGTGTAQANKPKALDYITEGLEVAGAALTLGGGGLF